MANDPRRPVSPCHSPRLQPATALAGQALLRIQRIDLYARAPPDPQQPPHQRAAFVMLASATRPGSAGGRQSMERGHVDHQPGDNGPIAVAATAAAVPAKAVIPANPVGRDPVPSPTTPRQEQEQEQDEEQGHGQEQGKTDSVQKQEQEQEQVEVGVEEHKDSKQEDHNHNDHTRFTPSCLSSLASLVLLYLFLAAALIVCPGDGRARLVAWMPGSVCSGSGSPDECVWIGGLCSGVAGFHWRGPWWRGVVTTTPPENTTQARRHTDANVNAKALRHALNKTEKHLQDLFTLYLSILSSTAMHPFNTNPPVNQSSERVAGWWLNATIDGGQGLPPPPPWISRGRRALGEDADADADVHVNIPGWNADIFADVIRLQDLACAMVLAPWNPFFMQASAEDEHVEWPGWWDESGHTDPDADESGNMHNRRRRRRRHHHPGSLSIQGVRNLGQACRRLDHAVHNFIYPRTRQQRQRRQQHNNQDDNQDDDDYQEEDERNHRFRSLGYEYNRRWTRFVDEAAQPLVSGLEVPLRQSAQEIIDYSLSREGNVVHERLRLDGHGSPHSPKAKREGGGWCKNNKPAGQDCGSYDDKPSRAQTQTRLSHTYTPAALLKGLAESISEAIHRLVPVHSMSTTSTTTRNTDDKDKFSSPIFQRRNQRFTDDIAILALLASSLDAMVVNQTQLLARLESHLTAMVLFGPAAASGGGGGGGGGYPNEREMRVLWHMRWSGMPPALERAWKRAVVVDQHGHDHGHEYSIGSWFKWLSRGIGSSSSNSSNCSTTITAQQEFWAMIVETLAAYMSDLHAMLDWAAYLAQGLRQVVALHEEVQPTVQALQGSLEEVVWLVGTSGSGNGSGHQQQHHQYDEYKEGKEEEMTSVNLREVFAVLQRLDAGLAQLGARLKWVTDMRRRFSDDDKQ